LTESQEEENDDDDYNNKNEYRTAYTPRDPFSG